MSNNEEVNRVLLLLLQKDLMVPRALRILVAALLLTACGQHALPSRPDPDRLELRPGDAIRVTVWRMPELSGEFMVQRDGTLAHPLFKNTQVARIPFEQAEEAITRLVAGFQTNPDVLIEPLISIGVGGEVNRPNLYLLRPAAPLTEAVAMAGGTTDRARQDRVVLIRNHRRITVPLFDAGAGLRTGGLQSGDQVYVERRRSVFREIIAPVITLAGATAAIVNAVLRNQ